MNNRTFAGGLIYEILQEWDNSEIDVEVFERSSIGIARPKEVIREPYRLPVQKRVDDLMERFFLSSSPMAREYRTNTICRYPFLDGHAHQDPSMARIFIDSTNPVTKSLIRILSVPVIKDGKFSHYHDSGIISDGKKVEERTKDTSVFSSGMLDILNEFDNETYAHNLIVGELSKYIAESINTNSRDNHPYLPKGKKALNLFGLAGALHDIGKILTPREILEKKGRLSEAEFEEIKLHTNHGHMMLDGIRGLEMAALVAYFHHERHDGAGYHGRRRNGIPLYSSIVMFADILDALTDPNRPYKEPYDYDKCQRMWCEGEEDWKGSFDGHLPPFLQGFIKSHWDDIAQKHQELRRKYEPSILN